MENNTPDISIDNFKDALKIYKELILIDKTNPQLKLFLGTLYLQIEDYQQAKNYLEQSLEIDKNNTSVLSFRSHFICKEIFKPLETKFCNIYRV